MFSFDTELLLNMTRSSTNFLPSNPTLSFRLYFSFDVLLTVK